MTIKISPGTEIKNEEFRNFMETNQYHFKWEQLELASFYNGTDCFDLSLQSEGKTLDVNFF